jgi:16S rRNA (uracil1498-N3)-methyltransferase
MAPRFLVPPPLAAGTTYDLPAGCARHVQVLRLQPGDAVTLFDGSGGEWSAQVASIGRSAVSVHIGEWLNATRELAFDVTLAIGMPANDRMDGVVEKATELGVRCIQPVVCERSVLRLQGERAYKKIAHWQAIAAAASEQCGRTRVPTVQPVQALSPWLRTLLSSATDRRYVLSLRAASPTESAAGWFANAQPGQHLLFLSGPEGGLSDAEESAALDAAFQPVSLGPRVLRADTAPLAALAALALHC